MQYNSINKVLKILGCSPSLNSVIGFIKSHYNIDDLSDCEVISDILGYYKIDSSLIFDNNGEFLKN